MALPDEPRFFGKYRGIVVDGKDQKNMGRVKVKVPALFGDQPLAEWAWPCLPIGQPIQDVDQDGYLEPIPVGTANWEVPSGSLVWVEFEMGDIDKPIWCGFWGE